MPVAKGYIITLEIDYNPRYYKRFLSNQWAIIWSNEDPTALG